MKKIAIIFSIFLFFFNSPAFAKSKIEEHKEFLAQQKPASLLMRKLNSILASQISTPRLCKPASKENEQLWKQAQTDLQIPEDYYAPIQEMDVGNNQEKPSAQLLLNIAHMDVDTMYMHPILDKKSYGTKRQAFYHEAVHHKYLDQFSLWRNTKLYPVGAPFIMYALVATKTGSYCSYKFHNHKTPLISRFSEQLSTVIALASGFYAFAATSFFVKKAQNTVLKEYTSTSEYIEHRADLESAYSLQCSVCVEEFAHEKRSWRKESIAANIKNGYLSAEEFALIAQEHKRNNRICEHHKKSRWWWQS